MQIKPYIMGKVDKLIFNELASHRAVTFPGIGTLWVEHVPADMSGDKVRPPQNKVRYTSKPHEGARTVAEIIGLQGAGPADAEKEYNEWLNNAVTPRGFVIDGAGELKSKFFYPSEDFVRVLNPVTETATAVAASPAPAGKNVPSKQEAAKAEPEAATAPAENEGKPKSEPTKKKGLSRNEKVWIFLIVLFVLILAGGWGYWWYNGQSMKPADPEPARTTQPAPPTSPGTDTTAPAGIVAQDSAATAQQPANTPQPTQGVAATPQLPDGTTAAVAGRYYIVGGVFSVASNADKYIRENKPRYPDWKYEKMPFKGKTMVSIYSSDTENEAQRMLNRLIGQTGDEDLWIYKGR